MSTTTNSTAALPLQPSSMSPAQLAAVSFLARYSGATHALYSTQLGRWFAWCEANRLDSLVGIQRAHVQLYVRELGEGAAATSSGTFRGIGATCVTTVRVLGKASCSSSSKVPAGRVW